MKSEDLLLEPGSPTPQNYQREHAEKIAVLLFRVGAPAEEADVENTPEAMAEMIGAAAIERLLDLAPRYNVIANADREEKNLPENLLGVRGDFLVAGVLRAEIGREPRYTGLRHGGKNGEKIESTVRDALSLIDGV